MDRFLEFSNNHMLLVFGLLVGFFVLVFSELRRKASGLINIEATEAVKLINNDAAVIDLRSADAYSRAHIVNARNIPFDEFEAKKSQLDKLKNKPVLAVSDSGVTSNRTNEAASSLIPCAPAAIQRVSSCCCQLPASNRMPPSCSESEVGLLTIRLWEGCSRSTRSSRFTKSASKS